MFVYVEGNIGSGKTTICNRLKEYGYRVLLEPVDLWIESGKLQEFYDGHLSAFEFQKYVVSTLYDRQKNIDASGDVIILERSLLSSLLFAKANNLSEAESRFIDRLVRVLYKDGVHIFIDTDYWICQDRIGIRNRGEESGISLDYLKKLEDVHRQDFGHVHRIDGNASLDDVLLEVQTALTMLF
jgi:deoxyadenosine/deoxycytidine kinase